MLLDYLLVFCQLANQPPLHIPHTYPPRMQTSTSASASASAPAAAPRFPVGLPDKLRPYYNHFSSTPVQSAWMDYYDDIAIRRNRFPAKKTH